MYWIPFCKQPIFLNTREKKPLPVGNKSNSFQYIKNKSWGGGRGGAYRCISRRLVIRLQSFEGRLVLTQGQILTRFLFLLGKSIFPDYFLDSFLFFLEHQIIKLWAKRTKLNLAFKLSYLICNFELTLDYLNPAFNNPAQMFTGNGPSTGGGAYKRQITVRRNWWWRKDDIV